MCIQQPALKQSYIYVDQIVDLLNNNLTVPRIVQDSMGNRQMAPSLDTVPVGYQRSLSVTLAVANKPEAALAQSPGKPVDNFYQAAGLRMRSLH